MTDLNGIDVTFRICGAAGDGSLAAGSFLNRAAARMGYHIMNIDLYPAEIRGFGKSVAHTRISDSPVQTPGSLVDCLVSLNDLHAITELDTLREGAVILYDSKPPNYMEEDEAIAGFVEPGMIGYGVPLGELSSIATKSARSRNIVALGALTGIFHLPSVFLRDAISDRFARKSAVIAEMNLRAFDLGLEYATTELVKADGIDFRERVPGASDDVVVVSGNEAVARGCLDAGVRLYAGYPITPATKIMEILAKELPKQGGVVVQTEDEISAIGHVIGGGFAGKRSVTATSGPGLSLMTEFLNLAVMAEVPVVVVNGQRGGPSTGLPTKTEQSDLNIAVFGGSGDSPRPVIAPADVTECYELTVKAFEVAEAFQTPVILLTDLFLGNRVEDITWPEGDLGEWGIYQNRIVEPLGAEDYKRFAITTDGVSPRSIPGMPGLHYPATGLEHDERGFPEYSPENHLRMTEKRYRKFETLLETWPAPIPEGAAGELDVGIISWGSTIGTAREALELLQDSELQAGGLFPRLIWPLHSGALMAFSNRSRHLIVAEGNHSGQFANMVEALVCREVIRITEIPAGPIPSARIIEVAGGLN
ncbi:2-oxoacid:acceptor oxidoreductase subunit alpha [Gemmatimonadota bacterium]